MRLDVGCGARLTGDVNCDLYKEYTPQADFQNKLSKVDTSKNFVQCDAQHLPFKDNSFSEVYSHHTIEHVDNPFLMLKEMVRVSNGTIEIYTPHRFLPIRRYPYHKCHFNKTWFYKALKKLSLTHFTIEYSKFYVLPHDFFPLFRFPIEIKVVSKK